MASVGKHCILELYGCPSDALNDRDLIVNALRQAAERAGATWMGEVAHKFEPQGVTALGLLAESHISIHTWPEIGYAAADVFTCGSSCDPVLACELLAELMGADRHTMTTLPRATQLTPREVLHVNPDEAHMASTEGAVAPGAPLRRPPMAIRHSVHEIARTVNA